MDVFVSCGTDHHRFDRLVGWVERWALAHPDSSVTVQHGASRAPDGCRNLEFLGGDEIVAAFADADVVVVSAGPGGVMDARRVGRRPIAVPREQGEAVDAHQVAFARHAADNGLVFVAETEAAFAGLLDRALSDPDEFRCEPPGDEPPAAADEVGRLVDRLVLGS